MFKNTIKQFLYVTLQEKANAINILGKYVYCAGGSITRNSGAVNKRLTIQGECVKAIPHNSKCRYGERGTAAAKPKAQIILDAAKVSAASGGNSEPKQGQRSQSGWSPKHDAGTATRHYRAFGNADAVPQPPKRCLSRQAGIVRCCLKKQRGKEQNGQKIRRRPGCGIGGAPDRKVTWNNLLYAVDGETIGRARSPDRAGAVRKQKLGLWRRRHPSKRARKRGRNDSQIFLGHLAQSPGMVKTIPYRLVYNV